MNEQPEALRLSRQNLYVKLRRQHEVIEELIAALKEILDGEGKSFRELCEQARAAITKAEGETA
jgi:hypothetical protein